MLNSLRKTGGSAGTVVLLHAFPLSATMWAPQLDFLAEAGYDAIAPNAYGFDGSPSKPGWSMDDYARDLARLLDAAGCPKATIVGLSMGGYQAFAFHRLFPERVVSLVLCDTRSEADSPDAAAQRREFRSAVEQKGPGEAADRMAPNFFSKAAASTRPELESHARETILRQPADAISEGMRAIAERPDSTGSLAAIDCPVLIMVGTEDRVTTPECAASMHEKLPSSTMELLPGAGHISNLENPGLFNRLLLAHLQSQKGRC